MSTSANVSSALQATRHKPTHSERFANRVMAEFNGDFGELRIADYHKRLIQGYFIGIDRALKNAEDNRIAKNKRNSDHKFDNELPYIWDNVNLQDLVPDVVAYGRMGLDMTQDNHLFAVPMKNNKLQKYDITLMPGYNGIQYIALRYAIEQPTAVTVELVYSTDIFKIIKKSHSNTVESYEFEITDAFNRGEIKGGFGYIEYSDPAKNKLIVMSKADMEKRKPKHASAEFWGGTKKIWENGVQVEVETDGWYAEMCLKTLKREVFSAKHMPRDPHLIDESYHHMKMIEMRAADMEIKSDMLENANTIIIDMDSPAAEDSPQPPTSDSMACDRTGETDTINPAPPEDGVKTGNPTPTSEPDF